MATAAKRSSAHSRLRQLQHRIYRSLEREAETLLGPPPASIRRYERASARDFRGSPRVATKEALIAEIRRHDVSFIADCHTFAQTQRTALRLLREAVLPGERWALGLELISSQHQDALDAYQAGRIDTEQFHERIRYREEWGFPWQNYEPLFAWARERGVRLIALNRPRELAYRNPAGGARRGRDLQSRDQWAAGVITDLVAAHPGLRVAALYGGYHVGRSHLPEQLTRVSRVFLGRELSSVSIHQNHAPLYWKLARQRRELHAQVIRLKRDTYCVFSGTPWAQLQSIIASVEGEIEEFPDGEGSEGNDDFLGLTRAYGDVIADFLGVARPSFASLTLRTVEEADFVDGIKDSLRASITSSEIALIRKLVGLGERIYIPSVQLAYLASPSHNWAAEYAAIHVLRRARRRRGFYVGDREDFYRLALETCFGFLGGLILNPKRKCDLPRDHEARLRQLERGARESYAGEREARRITLAHCRRGGSMLRSVSYRTLPAYLGARYLGQILAKRLHPILLSLRHRGPQFESCVETLMAHREFEAAYLRLRELSAASPRKVAGRKGGVLVRKSDAI